MTFVYPIAAEMSKIQADLNRGQDDRVGLKIFPTKPVQTFFVRWQQEDNAYGLMQWRGLDGTLPKVTELGFQTYLYEPGVYGERMEITEREYRTRANALDLTTRVDITELVGAKQKLLTTRKFDRMEYNVWQLLLTGTITIVASGPTGQQIYTDSYSVQTYTATVPWGTTSTATPVVDMQNLQQKSVGHGVSFGPDSSLYVNQIKANQAINNTNANDLGGRKNALGATATNTLVSINQIFMGMGLPKLDVYDKGYQPYPVSGPITNAATQFSKFIGNSQGVLVGNRLDGGDIGEFQQTVQTLQPGAAGPGEYSFVADYFMGTNAPKTTPGKLEVVHGFDGGLALKFPSAVVSATL